MTAYLIKPSSPQRIQFTAANRGSEVRAAALVAGTALVLVEIVVMALALVRMLCGGSRALAWAPAALGWVYSAAFAVVLAELVTPVVGEVTLIVWLLVQAGRS